MPTIGEALAGATLRLAKAGVTDADREPAWLLAHVLNSRAGTLRLRHAEALDPLVADQFERLVTRRAHREPIQYILGNAEFMGMVFRVTPAVLIPRLDTETLVRAVAALLHGPVRMADIGTGSGAIAIGLLSLLQEATAVAVDISPAALAVAASNAATLGMTDRIEFREGDLLEPIGGLFVDAIVSNPPYIGVAEMGGLMPEVRDWEPHLALTPGVDALLFYRRLAHEAPKHLKPGGLLAVEVGVSQAAVVAELFEQSGFNVSIHRDTAGVERAVVGTQR